MKTFVLTLTIILSISFIIPKNITAQTHRLLSKIEETKLGNNIWDKVTVMVPNTSYQLNKVTYENNTLTVLFDYSQTKSKPSYFTFNLSDYNINFQQIGEQAAYRVIAKPAYSVLKNWPSKGKTVDPPIGSWKCPVYCPF